MVTSWACLLLLESWACFLSFRHMCRRTGPLIAFVALNLPYLYMDQYKLFQQYRVFPVNNLDRTTLGVGLTDYVSFPHLLVLRTFWMLMREHVVQLLPILLVATPLLQFVGFTTTVASLPSWSVFCTQFVVFNVVEDAGFYWIHRLMHTRALYKYHQRHHDFTEPFSLTGEISHPVEFVLNILLPLMAGPFIMCYLHGGVHILSLWIWITFREIRGTDAHSGYNLPFHPLRLIGWMYGGPIVHGFHHTARGRRANYGGYLWWDYICGTDKPYKDYLREPVNKADTIYLTRLSSGASVHIMASMILCLEIALDDRLAQGKLDLSSANDISDKAE